VIGTAVVGVEAPHLIAVLLDGLVVARFESVRRARPGALLDDPHPR
jgi:hypothetical protein